MGDLPLRLAGGDAFLLLSPESSSVGDLRLLGGGLLLSDSSLEYDLLRLRRGGVLDLLLRLEDRRLESSESESEDDEVVKSEDDEESEEEESESESELVPPLAARASAIACC